MKRIQILIDKIKSSDIGKRMATGAFWSFSGTALAKFIVLVASIICAHVLGQKEYGEFGLVRSTINMFVVFGSAGLGLTATKFIAEYKTNNKERINSIYILTNGFAFITGLIVTIAILLAAPYLAVNMVKEPSLEPAIKVGALLLFVTVINAAQEGTITGFEDFKSRALNTLLGSIAESFFMILGGYLYGVIGAVLGYGTGFIVLYICNNIAISRNLNKNGIKRSLSDFEKKDLALLYKFSLPAALSSIMVAPVFWIVRSMLVRFDSFSELAIYEAADQWKVIILFIPSAVSQIVLPILSSIVKVDKTKFWRVLHYNLLLNTSIATLLTLLVCIFSGFIMRLYGTGYNNSMPLIILSISTIFTSLAAVIGISIQSRAKMWIGFSFNCLWAIMTISFTFFYLLRGMGASGVALGILSAYMLHALFQYLYLRNSIKQDKE